MTHDFSHGDRVYVRGLQSHGAVCEVLENGNRIPRWAIVRLDNGERKFLFLRDLTPAPEEEAVP